MTIRQKSFSLLSCLWSTALLALAPDVKVDSEFIPAATQQSDRIKVEGWDRYLKLGLYGNISDNNNVVGKDEGQATTIGGKIEGALDFKQQGYEWLNSLSMLAAFSRTPQLPRYVKGDDALDVESLYKHYLSDSFGAFARLNADFPMFEGHDNRVDVTDYVITRRDGSVDTESDDRLKLTDGTRPFKLRESLGVFANLWAEEILHVDAKAGIGFRQVYADRQFVLADNKDTLEVEVAEIRNSAKAGYEVGTDIGGNTVDKRVTYKFSANFLFPFHEDPENDATGRTLFQKRVIDISGKLTFQLLEWASLDYLLKVVRDPSILPDAQISQSYLFSINKVLASRRE